MSSSLLEAVKLLSLEVLGKSKLTRSDGLWPCVKVVLSMYNVQCTMYILDGSVKVAPKIVNTDDF